MIELERVSVIYNKGTLDEKVALKDVDLLVEDGRFVVIVGANGAGKSTLMKVVVGEVKPTFGVCRIMGQVLKEEKIFKCGSKSKQKIQASQLKSMIKSKLTATT
jgi:putative ABC transport system ATP-binding protein